MTLTTITVSGMWFSTASIIVLCCSATNDTCMHELPCLGSSHECIMCSAAPAFSACVVLSCGL